MKSRAQWKKLSKRRKKKILFFLLSLFRYLGFWQPEGPASPLPSSAAAAAAVVAMLGCVLCALVKPACQSASSPSTPEMLGRRLFFAREGAASESATLETRRRWFLCVGRVVPTQSSDAGVGVCGREREGTMDWYELPLLLLVFPPPPSTPPPSFNSSRLPQCLFLPPSSPLVFFLFLSIYTSFFPSPLPPSFPPAAQCNYGNGFFPPRLMASDILS